jgi:ADP-heptose:LPS heptosyltransferase
MSVPMNVYQELERYRSLRIAVVRALPGLGDFLCAVPALRALRSAFPVAHITFVGLPSARALVHRFNAYLDDWLEFPGFLGIPEVPFVPEQTALFLNRVQSFRFDLVLQLHGNGSCINPFILQFGAKLNAVFFPAEQHCPIRNGFLPYPEQQPEIWRLLYLLKFLNIPLQGAHLEFPLKIPDWQTWSVLVETYGLNPGNYVCIHPGASVGDKRWLPSHFAQVADCLSAQGWQIVLTGVESELLLTSTVANTMRFPAVNLAGQTRLGTLAMLLKNARLLICNDTGVSHLADALQTNSVVIFSNSDPQRWGPLDRHKHRVVGEGIQAHHPTPAIVLQAALELLDEVVYAS